MPPPNGAIWRGVHRAPPASLQHVRLAVRSASTGASSWKQSPSLPTTDEARSSSLDSPNLPPESPKFIFMPSPPQPDLYAPPRQKGVLPTPRSPFRRKKDRASRAALEAATPEPALEREPPAHLPAARRAQIAAKASLAAQRRSHLRSSTVQLRARYRKEHKAAEERAEKHQRMQAERLRAPQREDERLAMTTVRKSTTPASATLQEDPRAAERLETRRARYAALQARNQERRADALHVLYQNAGNFIVDEKGLSEAVEAAFETPFYQTHPDRGVWDAEGFPEDLQWLVAQQATRKSQYARALSFKGINVSAEPDDRLLKRGRERVERMAELLTRPVGEETEGEAPADAETKSANDA